MDTLEDSNQSSRRRHGVALKAQVLAECAQPHASVASIAMAHGLNVNLVQEWRRLGGKSQAPTPSSALEFAALPLTVHAQTPATAANDIAIELRRGPSRSRSLGRWPALHRVRRGFARCCGEPRVIRVAAVWRAVEPLDMRAGTDTALGRVVKVFGDAHPHHAYLFDSRRANRLKVLVHDGIGSWLCACRLHHGRFLCASPGLGTTSMVMTREQLDALVMGLPWQRLGKSGVIRVV